MLSLRLSCVGKMVLQMLGNELAIMLAKWPVLGSLVDRPMLSTCVKGHPRRKGTIYDTAEVINLVSPHPLPLLSLTGNPPSDFYQPNSSSGFYCSRIDLTWIHLGLCHPVRRGGLKIQKDVLNPVSREHSLVGLGYQYARCVPFRCAHSLSSPSLHFMYHLKRCCS